MKKNKQLLIVGAGEFASIAFEYFQYDSEYEVIAFCVESQYLDNQQKNNLPVVALEDIEKNYDPNKYCFFTAIVYQQLNRVRTRLLQTMRNKGYQPASYISSNAFVWSNAKIGDHCFIFENNTVQPFVEIGDNVILWSGNHIGHSSKINDNCYISSHCVISGFCEIGKNNFLGINCTIENNTILEEDNFIGAGSIIRKNTKKKALYQSQSTPLSKVNTHKLLKIKE